MKPTHAHFALWAYRKAPASAKGLRLATVCDIDSIINARAGIKWSTRTHNALSLAFLVRSNCARSAQRGTLGDYLRNYGNTGGTPHERDRAPIYARWVRGLKRAKRRAAK